MCGSILPFKNKLKYMKTEQLYRIFREESTGVSNGYTHPKKRPVIFCPLGSEL